MRGVPSRHGVHLPQDSLALYSASPLAASRTLARSSRTIIPPAPSMTPDSCRKPGLIGVSISDAGKIPLEGPPTAIAASSRPSGSPPPMSWTI